MSKAVMISIQPYYVFLIIAQKMGWDIPQEKTIEVRKDFPKDPAWNKVSHIYCSKNKKSFNRIPKQYQPLMAKFLGKVIGEFVCDRIDTYIFGDMDIPTPAYDGDSSCIEIGDGYFITNGELEQTSLTYEELCNYGKGKPLYGLHISDLKIYDEPKELGEFRKPYKYDDEGFIKCKHRICPYVGAEGQWQYDCISDCIDLKNQYEILRPFQSWGYVEGGVR